MKKFKFTVNGKDYAVEVKSCTGENAEVVVNGTQYQVKYEREEEEVKTTFIAPKRQAAPKAGKVEAPVAAPQAAPADGFKALAPLPGTVQQIYVNVGDAVKRGQKLMMYEAMKMENNFLAEVDGTIKEVKVRVGDNIIQGAVLFVIG